MGPMRSRVDSAEYSAMFQKNLQGFFDKTTHMRGKKVLKFEQDKPSPVTVSGMAFFQWEQKVTLQGNSTGGGACTCPSPSPLSRTSLAAQEVSPPRRPNACGGATQRAPRRSQR